MPAKPAPRQKSEKPAGRGRNNRVDRCGLDSLLGFQLHRASLALSRHFAKTMARLDLTQKQTSVLWLIAANPGISQITLAKELDMDRASMMALVDRLDARKVIRRERSRRDARLQELLITAKGHKLLAQSKIAQRRHERHFRRFFTAAELAVLMEALARLHS